MVDCNTSSDCTRFGYRLVNDVSFEYCCPVVAVSSLDSEEPRCANTSVLAVYTGTVVNVFPATTPTTAQSSTISTTQCFLMALNTSDIVMFPLILTPKRSNPPYSPRDAQSFVGYLTGHSDKSRPPSKD